MKKSLKIFAVSFFAFLCFSCSTFKIYVPGEEKRLSKNICSEYYLIADSYADLKKYDKACEYYQLALRDKNLRLASYYKLGRCYALAKKWDEALEVFKKLSKIDEDNFDIKLSIAYVTAMKGDLDEAFYMYEIFRESHSENQGVFENYISLMLEKVFIEKDEYDKLNKTGESSSSDMDVTEVVNENEEKELSALEKKKKKEAEKKQLKEKKEKEKLRLQEEKRKNDPAFIAKLENKKSNIVNKIPEIEKEILSLKELFPDSKKITDFQEKIENLKKEFDLLPKEGENSENPETLEGKKNEGNASSEAKPEVSESGKAKN